MINKSQMLRILSSNNHWQPSRTASCQHSTAVFQTAMQFSVQFNNLPLNCQLWSYTPCQILKLQLLLKVTNAEYFHLKMRSKFVWRTGTLFRQDAGQ
jgi:hypothetical protein